MGRSIHRMIWDKFRIQRDDTPPLTARHGTRDNLAELFNELGYKTGAEIGVQRGFFSITLCKTIPGLKLKCVDPWDRYSRNVTQKMVDEIYATAMGLLPPYGVEIIREKSMEAVGDVPDGSLDFVYIDALHDFDNVMMDIIRWAPKVRSGGMVSGHDYFKFHSSGVVPAVDVYTRMHRVHLYYITWERHPSFFWVRE